MAIEALSSVKGHDFDTFFSEIDSAVVSFQTSYTVVSIAYSSMFTPSHSEPKEYTAIITLDKA